jgi:cell division transport system ATP-binding protein
MIHLRNVSKYFDDENVGVKDISLHIKPKEFVSIVGQSGTGKTTIVRILTAEERASHGKVVIGGWDITDIAPRDIPILRRQIGVVFQDYKLLPKKTAQENVAFALEVCGTPSRRIRDIVPQVLRVVGLDGKADRYPRQLSGGEQQRVSIARALVHGPRILIADEPTGNLDAINSQEIIDILRRINEFGTTVLLVTHDKDIVNSIKRRVITLGAGSIIADQEGGRYKL